MEDLVQALRKNGMDATFLSTCEEAKTHILQLIPAHATVGIGGSVTIRQLNLIQDLRERGNEVYEHWQPGLSNEERKQAAWRALNAQYYLASSNALTKDGKLVNTDNTGNRVAAMVFGPSHVIIVVGTNKIVEDVADGIKRIKEKAAPFNCLRRKENTPCAETGRCQNCDSPSRLCRVTTIIEKKTRGVESLSVIIVGTELGY